ncbi:thioesterase II family protein [Candidimonas nitroreducens]|uniref:thioesterase II family protein n=1 Tax=Candidimonas nitroreducens TaxID=683354 RepID=UPI001303A4CC|nr:alpha/beta fold hydrolase [Candidimonas nitroreducens]
MHDPGISSSSWILNLRPAEPGQPSFVFFPHAGGSPLSIVRLAAELPRHVGVAVLALPRGGGLDDGVPPRRCAAAADAVAASWLALGAPARTRLILVGNSYGALLAYETARRLAQASVPPERLVVSGFRSPCLSCTEAPLHRLPLSRLRAELEARYGSAPGDDFEWLDLAQVALRADLEACDTYRHAHQDLLPVPVDALQLTQDSSVSPDELAAWAQTTRGPFRILPLGAGHFPWASQPAATARILLQSAGHGRESPLAAHA